METLEAFLSRQAARPFVWGESDCALFLADWYMARTGNPDPVAQFRSAYSSEEACVAQWGRRHLVRLVTRTCAQLGLARTADPQAGDIAILALRIHEQRAIVGAIRVEQGWVMRAETGLTRIPPPRAAVLAAWEI